MPTTADAERAAFRTVRDARVVEFEVTTDLEVPSYRGTSFAPNRCTVRIADGAVVSVTLERVDDEYGYGIDDPAGPDGAELAASYGGGDFLPEYRDKLPTIVQRALAAISPAK